MIPCIFKLRSEASNFTPHSTWRRPDFYLDISYVIMQLFYLLSLIPHGMASVTGFDTTFQSLADETLTNQRLLYNNRRFTVDFDRFYLGIAREGVTFLSRLFLSWVKPLMVKGTV